MINVSKVKCFEFLVEEKYLKKFFEYTRMTVDLIPKFDS